MSNIESKIGILVKSCSKNYLILGVLGITVVCRLPLIFLELPPYEFCDENMFAGKAWQFFSSSPRWLDEFRAGGVNVYPVMLVQIFLGLFNLGAETYPEFLILGRFINIIIFGVLTTFIIFLVSKEITNNYYAAVFGALIYTLSPYVNALSRHWYPDHYIAMFSALFLYVVVKSANVSLNFKKVSIFALVSALLISVKYTGLLALPIMLVLIVANNWLDAKKLSEVITLDLLVKWIPTFILMFLGFFVLVNPSLIVYPKDFLNGFMFNVQNYYGHDKAIFNNALFYWKFITIAFAGVIGGILFWIGVIVASVKLRTLPIFLIVLFLFLILLSLSSTGLVLNRNISIVVPVFCIFLSVAFKELGQFFKVEKFSRYIKVALISWVGFLTYEASVSYINDLQPDSRIEARAYLIKNSKHFKQPVGTNEFCSGVSPAHNILKTKRDPNNKSQSEYFVYNSYWNGFLADLYMNKMDFWSIPRQYLIHYYAFGQKDLFSRPDKKTLPLTKKQLHDKGYTLVKGFNKSGPEIWILKLNKNKK